MNRRQKKIALKMVMNVFGCIITSIILGMDYEDAGKIPHRDGRR